mmetsp:Transcript_15537/g.37268  ORF Transcript_15537/g.37268 Transcript_15537/m.37268 type:complete len:1079 (+) Transcript_15537:74-3310(+)
MKADVHGRSVVGSLYSHSSAAPDAPPSSRSGAASGSSQPHRSHPFSSISLAPKDAAYAVASGKDVLHILRLGSGDNANRLEEVRSGRISQHFQSPLQTSNAAAAGGQNPQYPHLRDALRLPGATPGSSAIPAPSAGGGGGININVTDVAWSLPQSYVIDNGTGALENTGNSLPRGGDGAATPGTHGSSDSAGFSDSYEELLVPMDVQESEKHSSNEQHYPPFIKRIYIVGGDHSASPILEDTSVVAAAGSNGVIAAWSAHSLISAPPSSNNSGGGGLFHARKSVGRSQQVSTTASIGQPEAAFLAHSRAVNRLAWHPTGRRPYLLLTASQDGSVKLWDRRATSSPTLAAGARSVRHSAAPVSQSAFNLNAKTWFGFGSAQTFPNAQMPTNAIARTATWHCVSTYQPKCEAVRDIKWNPFIDDVFAMVAGEWLCLYDIRINKPLVKESTHAGDATSVDWHPTQKYTIATGGGRDRSVKVWDVESSLNAYKEDDVSIHNMKANSVSFRSDNSENLSTTSHDSSEGHITTSHYEAGRNIQNANPSSPLGSQSNLSAGSVSPVKRSSSMHGLSHSRHHKKILPLHILNIAAPVTRIRWRRDSQYNHNDSMLAVATSSIYGANAGGNGSVGLWSYHRPYMPISVCEGHVEGAVTDFDWAPVKSRNKSMESQKYDNRLQMQQPMKDSSSIASDSSYRLKPNTSRRDEENRMSNPASSESKWQTILTVGRDGQCLLQNFSNGERPIDTVPRSTFALSSLSPFQPGFGSLQIMSVHQHVNATDMLKDSAEQNLSRSELVFSITDQGGAEDLSKESFPLSVDVAPELTHLSRFSELYVMTTGTDFATKADVCRHNASVSEGLNQKAITQMWTTLGSILDGSGLNCLPVNASDSQSNPMAYLLTPTLRNLLLQRANSGDVQTCVVLCEVMDVIVSPSTAGGAAKSRIPNLNIALVREWYLTYIDLLQKMCLFTQAASLIRNCRDPVVGALNQQSTTIHESCPRCGKPLLGGDTIQNSTGSGQRVCRSCRGRIGLCFLCHQPVKGIFVWCPGCGHGGHLDHALEWFSENEMCPTGCGHKCNLFKNHNPN